MDLSRNLSDVPRAEQRIFLKKKLRELKLVYAIDELTDQYSALSDLARGTLRKMRRFFRCGIAGMMLFDTQNRQPMGFYLMGIPRHDPDARGKALAIKQFLVDRLNGADPHGLDPMFPELGPSLALPAAWRRFPLEDNLVGALLVGQTDAELNEESIHFLGAITSQIDNALLHGRFLEKFRRTKSRVKRRRRQLDFMYEVSLSIGRNEDFVSLTRRILESSMQLVEVNRCSLMLYDEAKDALETHLVVGAPNLKSGFRLRMGEGVAGKALQMRQSLIAEKGNKDVRFMTVGASSEQPDFLTNLACIPLILDNKPLGVLNFTSTDPKYSVTPDELETLEVVSHLIILCWQRQCLFKLSTKDELTGLNLLGPFRKKLVEHWQNAAAMRLPLAIALFDIDHFKKINDRFGHLAGNEALKAVATILLDVCRPDIDVPARFGGEEFVLLLPGLVKSEAAQLAERIRQAVQGLTVTFGDQPLTITISGGVAVATEASSVDELLDLADKAMYRAKGTGRNRIVAT